MDITTLVPVVIIIVGVITEKVWLVAIAGVGLAAWTMYVLFSSGGEGHFRAKTAILLSELVATLFIMVVPIKENPAAIPAIIVAALALGVIATTGTKTIFGNRAVKAFVTTIFLVFVLSFFFPQSFKAMEGVRGKMDESLAKALQGGVEVRGVRLRGWGKLSQEVNFLEFAKVYPLQYFEIIAPPGTKFHLDNGEVLFVGQPLGWWVGTTQFEGAKRKEVVIHILKDSRDDGEKKNSVTVWMSPIAVELRGENVLSDPLDLERLTSWYGSRLTYAGPPRTTVITTDGKEHSLFELRLGAQNKVWFKGPAGKHVFLWLREESTNSSEVQPGVTQEKLHQSIIEKKTPSSSRSKSNVSVAETPTLVEGEYGKGVYLSAGQHYDLSFDLFGTEPEAGVHHHVWADKPFMVVPGSEWRSNKKKERYVNVGEEACLWEDIIWEDAESAEGKLGKLGFVGLRGLKNGTNVQIAFKKRISR